MTHLETGEKVISGTCIIYEYYGEKGSDNRVCTACMHCNKFELSL